MNPLSDAAIKRGARPPLSDKTITNAVVIAFAVMFLSIGFALGVIVK